MVQDPNQPFMPTVEITDDTMIRVADGSIKRLVDVIKDAQENNLWSIGWKSDDVEHGRTFHASHERAKNFVQQHDKLVNIGVEHAKPAGPPTLVKVSEWLYEWVHEFGDFWADFYDPEEAENYNGPTYN